MNRLMKYSDASYIREATKDERRESAEAARYDGGAGVITVEGVDCYVEDDLDDDDAPYSAYDLGIMLS